jgi:hypothetical protein
MRARRQDIGENARRPTENVIFQDYATIKRYVILYLTAVANAHIRAGHHILT